MLHDTLWNENAELVSRCLEHPFGDYANPLKATLKHFRAWKGKT